MSETHILAGAKNLVVSGTINAANTVSGIFRCSNLQLMDTAVLQININNFGDRPFNTAPVTLMPNSSVRFTGRTEILARLKDHFSVGSKDEVRKRKQFLLYGLGGIGKTQIVLKFIEEMSDS